MNTTGQISLAEKLKRCRLDSLGERVEQRREALESFDLENAPVMTRKIEPWMREVMEAREKAFFEENRKYREQQIKRCFRCCFEPIAFCRRCRAWNRAGNDFANARVLFTARDF